MDESIAKLLNAHLFSPTDLRLRKFEQVPKLNGIYAWWFDPIIPMVPIDDCEQRDGKSLLYVGIAPMDGTKPFGPVQRTLHGRIRTHMTNNAFGSTLRLSLGVLLGCRLRQVSATRLTFDDHETTLSTWLDQHAAVCWLEEDEPWTLEEKLIDTLSLPLNLRGNEKHPFYEHLTKRRDDARRLARGVI